MTIYPASTYARYVVMHTKLSVNYEPARKDETMLIERSTVSMVLAAFLFPVYTGGVQAAVSYAPSISTSVAAPAAPDADNPEIIAKGELNNDGNIDLVTVNETDGTITILLSNGAGGFSSVDSYTTGTEPRQVAIGDLNGDTYNDLVVPNTGSGDVTVLLNDGSGGFFQAAESPIVLAGIPTSPVIADFNGGNLDIAITNASTNSVHILSGDGDGTFTPWTMISVGAKPAYITAGYVNIADAFIDLVAVNFDAVPGTVSVLLGNGFGGFSEVLPRLQTGNRPWSVQIAQIEDPITDPSQDPDLVLVNYIAASTVKVFKGVGDGTFNTTPLTSVPVALKPHSVEVTDLNNDSLVDLVVASDNDPNKPPIPAVSITVLLGDGSGVFPNATFPAVKEYPLNGQPNKVVSLHLDNTDSLLDLAVANGLTGKVDVLLSVPTTIAPIAND